MGIHDMGWKERPIFGKSELFVCNAFRYMFMCICESGILNMPLIIFLLPYKVRFMNYAGCKRKFKVANFVARYKGAAENAAKAVKKGDEKLSGKKRKA